MAIGIIRPAGIAVFLAAMAIFAAVGLLWVDVLAKRALEALGTEAVGARVDLRRAEISLFEQRVALYGLAVTDPDNPMRNLLEVEQIEFAADWAPLVFERLHIDTMVLSGLQLNTERAESGAIDRAAPLQRLRSGLGELMPAPSLPQLQIPSPAEAIAGEQLQSLALVAAIEQDMDDKMQRIEQRIAGLPDADAIAGYEQRLKALRSKDFQPLALLAKSSEIKALRDDFKSDIARVKSLRREITATQAYLQEKIAEVKAAPQADIARIRQKYSLSGDNIGALSARIFGREIAAWIDRGWRWYAQLAPYLDKTAAGASAAGDAAPPPPRRGQGVDIRFPEARPAPGFLVRQMRLSALHDAAPGGQIPSQFSGKLENINSRPGIWPQPMTFAIQARQLDAALQLEGSIDRRAEAADDRIVLALRRLPVRNLVLSSQPQLPVTVDTAVIDADAVLTARDGQLRLVADLAFGDLTLAPVAPAPSADTAAALLQALGELETAAFTITVQGSAEAPQVALESDLDTLLADIIRQRLAAKLAVFETQLEREIVSRTEGKLGPLNARQQGLDALLARVNDKGEVMDKLLQRL